MGMAKTFSIHLGLGEGEVQVHIIRIDQKVRDELTSWPSRLRFLPFPQKSLPPGTPGRAATPGHAPHSC